MKWLSSIPTWVVVLIAAVLIVAGRILLPHLHLEDVAGDEP